MTTQLQTVQATLEPADASRVGSDPGTRGVAPARELLPAEFHLILLVWGDEYVRLFTDVCLPALLADGNIPALAASFPTFLKVYTRPEDAGQIAASATFQLVSHIVETQFVPFDPTAGDDKYAAMTLCHRIALLEAEKRRAAVVFLAPDTIWANGSLATVARAAKAGKRAVLQGGLRVMTAAALPALRRFYDGKAPGAVAVPPRELVRVALDHMSPDFRAWFWDSPDFSRNPANVYWRVGAEGLVARCFHLHPLMLFPERSVASFVSTLDDDLTLLAIPRYDSIHVVDDSDEAFHVDLFEGDALRGLHTLPNGPSARYLAEWGLHCANVHHRRFVRHRLRWHVGDLSPAWSPIEVESDRIVHEVTRRLGVRYLATRVKAAAFGIDWNRLLAAAAGSRLGWSLQPPPPLWFRSLVAVLTACRLSRPVVALEARRRAAFAECIEWLFGSTVACRALDGFLAARQCRDGRRKRRARAVRRYVVANPASWLRVRIEPKRVARIKKRIQRSYERNWLRARTRRAVKSARRTRENAGRAIAILRSRSAKVVRREIRLARKTVRQRVAAGRRVLSLAGRSRRRVVKAARGLIARLRRTVSRRVYEP